ncbi:MAG: hypothetical protein KJZ74_02595 [Gemmatimonadales bacterium]|nr:hypothetical protein [Gemmatimonadota bacterium]MCL4212782.1 hypothetical protein [Gemmatimonadales bacterium]
MQRTLWLALGTAATAVLTWAVGWWTVPIVSAALAFVRRQDAATPLLAAGAAMLAWGLLLAGSALTAPVGEVMRVVGTAMGVGAAALLALTLAFAGLLAASAAALTRAIVGSREPTATL